MTGAPILRATTEDERTFDDPSEDVLSMLFEELEAGNGMFLIVESLQDPTGSTYAQVLRHDDGSYTFEQCAGGPKTHVGTGAADYRVAHAMLCGWAFDVPGWDDGMTWHRV